MRTLPKNVWILATAQALIMTVNSVVVFIGGLVGSNLTPIPKLATLPVACVVVGTAIASVPVTLLMKKIGRKKSFDIIMILSVVIACLASYSLFIESFYLFCLSTLLFGITSSCVMQFRFAAMESVRPQHYPKAASLVLLGGIVAAFIGPEVAVRTKDMFSQEFAGSFIGLGCLFILGLIALQFFQNPILEQNETSSASRPLLEIIKQPIFWIAVTSGLVGYSIMTFIMTATPVSMHMVDGHSLENTKWVIQTHIISMFLPSLFTAPIIEKFGVKKMIITGLIFYIICVLIGYLGHGLENYWISLILLGIGWNFLFIGGTTLLPRSYRAQERFKVQAANELLVFSAQAIASLSAGWFIFTLNWEALLFATLPMIILQLFFISFKLKQ